MRYCQMAGYIRDGIEETDNMEVRLMNLNQKETVDFSFVKLCITSDTDV